MKKSRVSKISNILRAPSAVIIFFILGLLLGASLNHSIFIVELAVLSLLTILLFILLKQKAFVGLALSFILGLGYFCLFSYLNRNHIEPGCGQYTVYSDPKKTGNNVEFLVKDQRGLSGIVQAATIIPLGYKDKLNICFDAKDNITSPAMSDFYLKSRYKTSYIVKNPEIEVLSIGGGLVRSLYNLADKVESKLSNLFSGNAASLAKGLLLGGSGSFTDDFKEYLKRSGTTHLVAVSGYNVSIITIIIFQLLRQMISKRFAVISSLIFLLLFCILTGGTASVLRASLMGFLYIFAKVIGRRSAMINSLFVAAFLMVLINPYLLWDVGFKLSFAATFGLVFLGEPLNRLLFGKLPDGFWKNMGAILGETLSATIFTLPILLGTFGRISLVSPVANLLILPLVPLAMLLIFIALIASYMWLNLGLFISGFANILLTYFLWVVRFFGNGKLSSLEFKSPHWTVIAVLYLLILIFTIGIRNKFREGYGNKAQSKID